MNKYGTVYLITIEQGDYYKYATPFRLYSTREKADRFMGRLNRHWAKKPAQFEANFDDQAYEVWCAEMREWERKHPGGADNSYRSLSDWAVLPMTIC